MTQDRYWFIVEMKSLTHHKEIESIEELSAEREALESLPHDERRKITEIRVTSHHPEYQIDTGWYVPYPEEEK